MGRRLKINIALSVLASHVDVTSHVDHNEPEMTCPSIYNVTQIQRVETVKL